MQYNECECVNVLVVIHTVCAKKNNGLIIMLQISHNSRSGEQALHMHVQALQMHEYALLCWSYTSERQQYECAVGGGDAKNLLAQVNKQTEQS